MNEENKKLARENTEQIENLETRINDYEKFRAGQAEDKTTIKTLFKWKAPERVFVKKDRNFFVLISAAFIVGIIISAFLEAIMFIILTVFVLVILYIQHSIPPKEIEHEITNKGIKSFGRIFLWKDIENFWVTKRSGHILLNVDLSDKTPTRLILLLDEEIQNKVVKELLNYIDYNDNPGFNFLVKYTEGEYVPVIEHLDVKGLVPDQQKLRVRQKETPG